MNTIRNLILAFTFILAPAAFAQDPPAPTLQAALKLSSKQTVIFCPTHMPANFSFNLTRIRMGDGSVKPGEKRGALLVIYSSIPDENGTHAVLRSQWVEFNDGTSPVTHFTPFKPSRDAASFVTNGKCGIIAVLIGLFQSRPGGPFLPSNLPGRDTISAEINSDDPNSIGLLLPAVQKVSAAAARL